MTARALLFGLALALASGCPSIDDDDTVDDDDSSSDDDDSSIDDDDDTPCPDADGDGVCDDDDPCFGDDATGDGDGDGICDDRDLCTGTEACGLLWTISSHEGRISLRDLDSGAELAAHPLRSDDETSSWGAYGLTRHPDTGVAWIVLSLPPKLDRWLATVEPSTGLVSTVGVPGVHLSAIAFDPTGRLLAVSGSGDEPPETLFELDTTTGEATELVSLATGTGGEALALHPATGQLLHMSGGGADQVAEWLDPVTLARTPLPLSGPETDSVNGLTWSPILGLWLACGQDDRLWTLTLDGLRAPTGVSLDTNCNGLMLD